MDTKNGEGRYGATGALRDWWTTLEFSQDAVFYTQPSLLLIAQSLQTLSGAIGGFSIGDSLRATQAPVVCCC